MKFIWDILFYILVKPLITIVEFIWYHICLFFYEFLLNLLYSIFNWFFSLFQKLKIGSSYLQILLYNFIVIKKDGNIPSFFVYINKINVKIYKVDANNRFVESLGNRLDLV